MVVLTLYLAVARASCAGARTQLAGSHGPEKRSVWPC